jgi:hypothetical protein
MPGYCIADLGSQCNDIDMPFDDFNFVDDQHQLVVAKCNRWSSKIGGARAIMKSIAESRIRKKKAFRRR